MGTHKDNGLQLLRGLLGTCCHGHHRSHRRVWFHRIHHLSERMGTCCHSHHLSHRRVWCHMGPCCHSHHLSHRRVWHIGVCLIWHSLIAATTQCQGGTTTVSFVS